KTVVEGREHLPASGRALLVCNHGGALPWDALVLAHALQPRVVRPLVEDPVMTAPFLGTLMTRLGCVRASQENAVRVLERDDVVAVFPEGMQGLSKLYRRRHKLARFGRGGFVKLAHKTGAAILPVALVGAEETAPLFGKIEMFFRDGPLPYLPITPFFPLPARWRIRIGAPIDVRARISEPNEVNVGQLAALVREQIQADVDKLVEERGKNVWL
ncbi:MAG TPA: lysophospholipid acyltransferase family protein, partial [Myxococcota bacterium]